MNDVEKSNIERKNSGKRIRRRKRMMSKYVIAVVMLVMTIGITACFTFLFNIDKIIVSGESQNYSYMKIVEKSGIRAGDNLFRLNTEKAEQQILDELRFVETADITRDFPSTLRIHVTRCIPAYNVQYDDGVLLVSRNGKILSDNNFYSDIENLPVIYGLEPADIEVGKTLKSANQNKYDAFSQLISRFDRDDNTQIESIDITNEYEIVVNYRNGLLFDMGNWSDVEYKLDLAQNVMNDENIKGKKGYLKMVGSNQCSFRGNGEAAETTAAETTVTTGTAVTSTTTVTTTVVPVDDYNYNEDYNNNNSNILTDEDGDGIPDQYGEYFADYDGDGYPDYPNDYNGNGIPDDQEVWMDVDGDGIPDYGYTDYDNDGVPDQWG